MSRRAETKVKHSRPLRPLMRRRRSISRHASIAIAAVLVPIIATSCSSDDNTSTSSTTSSNSADVGTTEVGETGAPIETNAPAPTAETDPGAPVESAAVPPQGGCSTVPTKEVVESIIGSTVLPVEDQGSVGCAYLGDGDNVGVYFEIETDPFEIEQFDTPDPQFATPVTDPGLPPGSFVQSGDFYAKQDDVLYKVTASVTGTEDDNQLATQLMIAWLAIVP